MIGVPSSIVKRIIQRAQEPTVNPDTISTLYCIIHQKSLGCNSPNGNAFGSVRENARRCILIASRTTEFMYSNRPKVFKHHQICMY